MSPVIGQDASVRDRSTVRRVFIAIQVVALAALVFVGTSSNATCLLGIVVFPIAGILALSSILVFYFVKRVSLRVAVFLLVLAEAGLALYAPMAIMEKWRDTPSLSDPARAVADARKLIQSSAREDGEVWIEPQDLPPSLRMRQVVRAQVHRDHLDLVTASHPDGTLGFRIWAADATRPHKERPTKYRDITWYFYNNDAAAAPDNIP